MGIKKRERNAVVVPMEHITHAILLIRGQKVMLNIDRKISCFSLLQRNFPT